MSNQAPNLHSQPPTQSYGSSSVPHSSTSNPPVPTLPQDELNMLSSSFSAMLALSNPQSVKVPVKSAKVFQSLSETAHLLPFTDSNFKGEKQYLAGSSKYRLAVELTNQEEKLLNSLKAGAELLLEAQKSTSNTKSASKRSSADSQLSQKNKQRVLEQLNLLRDMKTKLNSQSDANRHSVIERFTTLVKVSKTPTPSHPLLTMKGSTSPWYNRLRKTQLTRLFCTLSHSFQNQLADNLPPNPPHSYRNPNNQYNQQYQHPNQHPYRQYSSNPHHPQRFQYSKASLPNDPQSSQITQKLLNIFGSTHVGRAWIQHFLVKSPYIFTSSPQTSQHSPPQLTATRTTPNNNSSTHSQHPPHQQTPQRIELLDPSRQPLYFFGKQLRYPHLTPRQLLYMLISTHSHHTCKVHETRRKRLSYPCICINRIAQQQQEESRQSTQPHNPQQHQPNQSPSYPTQSTSTIPDPHFPALSDLNTTLSHITESKVKHMAKKATFTKMFHTPGPLSLLSSLLHSATGKSVRITTIGDVPAAPEPLCIEQRISDQIVAPHQQYSDSTLSITDLQSNCDYALNLACFDHIKQYKDSIPLLPSSIILPLLHSVEGLQNHHHWWSTCTNNNNDNIAATTPNTLTDQSFPATSEGQVPTSGPASTVQSAHISSQHTQHFIFNLFYNRSGNPTFIPQYDKNVLPQPNNNNIINNTYGDFAQSSPPPHQTTFQKGRLQRGIGGVLYGKLVFFDRVGNIGLEDALEYKWVWIPIPHTRPCFSPPSSSPNTHIEPANSTKKQKEPKVKQKTVQHGIWTIMARKLPRIILTSPTVVTAAIDNRQ